MRWKNVGSMAAVAMVATLLAGCGGTPASSARPAAPPPTQPSTTQAKPALKKATLRLEYLNAGSASHAPFYLALKKGYYKAAGIDLSIGQGHGSATTAQLVANGKATFGLCDAGTAIQLISKGLPIQIVAGFLETSPQAVIAGSNYGIHTFADLKGKSIGTPPGAATSTLLPAVFTAEHLTGQVTVVHAPASALLPSLMAHKVDAVTGFGYEFVTNLAAKGFHSAVVLSFADAGVNIPSTSVITRVSTIKNDPNLVQRFVAATEKGVAAMVSNPAAAARLYASLSSAKMTQAVAQKQLKSVISLLHTKRTVGKPLGYIAPQDIADSLHLLEKYRGLKHPLPVNRYFTNQFVPTSGS